MWTRSVTNIKTLFISLNLILVEQSGVNVFDELTEGCTYATVMTLVKETVGFSKQIATSSVLVLSTITTDRTTKVSEKRILLLNRISFKLNRY